MTNEALSGMLAGLAPELPALAGYDVQAVLSSMTEPVVGDLKIANDGAMFLWLAYAEREAWQPIRIMLKSHGNRSRGLPEPSTNIEKICTWCSKRIKSGWVVENRSITYEDTRDYGATFWFKDPSEAFEFTLKWAQIKCT